MVKGNSLIGQFQPQESVNLWYNSGCRTKRPQYHGGISDTINATEHNSLPSLSDEDVAVSAADLEAESEM